MRSPVTALACAFVVWSAAAVAGNPPDQIAKSMVADLQREFDAHQGELKKDTARLQQTVDRVLAPHFDVPYIAQLVLARHWKTATPDQRRRFQDAFKGMLIRSYADALLDVGTTGKMQWQPLAAKAPADDVVVHATAQRAGGQSLDVGLAMRQREGDWKVYDITVDSVSLVTSFRAQIGSQIKQSGIDAVITRLESGDAGKG
jgi:phospholipid transport system substrate-binding protein